MFDTLTQQQEARTLLERQQFEAREERLKQEAEDVARANNTFKLTNAVAMVQKYVGKTWYVFAGSTPEGWDCSGLVMWTYSHLGIELHHGATAQMKSGTAVDEPKFGDIAVFSYHGSSKAYHVGIYVGPDTMIHSGGKKGDKTELQSISAFAGNYSSVSYTRIVETK